MTRQITLTAAQSDPEAYALLFGQGVALPEPVTITLDKHRPKSWNTMYSGIHYRTRMQYVQEAHDAVKAALVLSHVEPFTVPVAITVTAYFKGAMSDPDNVTGKLYLDGLRHAGVLIDDTPEYVTSVTCISRKDNKNPRLEITIEPEVTHE